MGRDEFFAYLTSCSLGVVALDERGHATQANAAFEAFMGPLFKFTEFEFCHAAVEDGDGGARLKTAVANAREAYASLLTAKKSGAELPSPAPLKLRNVEMLSLAAGLPIKKHFDWTVSTGADGGVVLFGSPCTTEDLEKIEKDAELIDFLQNAPIAMHWLSGEGIVLWANQTELDVLGYTAEEYIGQPIMKFCPDEEELVLEIFKQLGSGNTIKDVPVRFRTKDGRVVDLLIDSNVKYTAEGKFGHTRCFIRDDTGRKVREGRASLLLEENKRSLKQLDSFMSRVLQHIRNPLHVLVNSHSLVKSNVIDLGGSRESLRVLEEAGTLLDETTALTDDVADLVRLDHGSELKVCMERIDLKALGVRVLRAVPPPRSGVALTLELGPNPHGPTKDLLNVEQITSWLGFGSASSSGKSAEGPAAVNSDGALIGRALGHLLKNSSQRTESGSITLKIGYAHDRCIFAVHDTGPGLPTGAEDKPFQRYFHHALLDDEIKDFDAAMAQREKLDEVLGTRTENGIGIGLNLTYHLVQALGGELRFESKPGQTIFWFALPADASTGLSAPQLADERIPIGAAILAETTKNLETASLGADAKNDVDDKVQRRSSKRKIEFLPEGPRKTPVYRACSVAQRGAFHGTGPPLVLVVEDVDVCAKLLAIHLKKLNCITEIAENGKIAVDKLRNARPDMYSMVLMDIRMPVMDGIEATSIIKKELNLKVPVIALTGELDSELLERCKEVGFDDFRTKPLRRHELEEIIVKHASFANADENSAPSSVAEEEKH